MSYDCEKAKQEFDWDKINLARRNEEAKAELDRYEDLQPEAILHRKLLFVIILFLLIVFILGLIDIHRHKRLMEQCSDYEWEEICSREFTDPVWKQEIKVFMYIFHGFQF